MPEPSDDKNTSLLARCQAIHRQALAITANKVANAHMAKPRPLKARNAQMTFFQLAPTDAVLDQKKSNPIRLRLEQQRASAMASADKRYLDDLFTPTEKKPHCVGFMDQYAIMESIYTVKNKGGFDCVTISGLNMMLLMQQQIPANIERLTSSPR